MRRPHTLFGLTGFTLTVSLIAFLLFTLLSLTFFVLLPFSHQAADDLAALMVLSAKTWAELPPQTRSDFEKTLLANHDISIGVSRIDEGVPVSEARFPYLLFLQEALLNRTGQRLKIFNHPYEEGHLFLEIPTSGGELELSFHTERLGTRISEAVLFILLAGAMVTLFASLLLVRRITLPLSRLSEAAVLIGESRPMQRLPETGPRELRALACRFNRMQQQISGLLENRTTLLAGISHDLRTPLSRMRIVLELLPASTDPALLDHLVQDLEEMDIMIARNLELARELGEQKQELLDLRKIIGAVVERFRTTNENLLWRPGEPCRLKVNASAIQRVLGNLLENAIRFSPEGQEVEIKCICEPEKVSVVVSDRGPGIPEAQLKAVFRPFYRLEGSRSRVTGGSGLGLAVAKQLCNANHWELRLARRQGGGTEAHLEIMRT